MTTRLPVMLESLRIATPCQADWDDMSGNDRVRFCGRCEKNVYNLSAMTRLEAESLVQNKDGRVCVRLYKRHDGTVITADCPVGVRRERLRQRVWASVSGAVASVALAFGLFSGRARADLSLRDGKKVGQRHAPVAMGGAVAIQVPKQPEKLMGKMAPPPPPPPPPKPPKPPKEPEENPAMMGDVSPEFQ